MRTFFAVFPPAEVVDAIAGAVERIRWPGDSVSWVKPSNVHYTLRFLGELSESRVRAAARAGEAAVVGLQHFSLRLGAPGVFPNARRPRVLWLGASEGGEALVLLAKSLDEALRREGFGAPEKPFAPHLTLGRVRESGSGGASVAETFLGATFPTAAFDVPALSLIHSKLDPRGSIYEPIGRFALH
ncbi:MAG: RNA 2',3'-cyclic phosphodiesterase [Candidatus Eiseniibacteriota bacterium]